MKIYFIRHGQTEDNKVDRLQGHSDSALTEKGVKQAGQFGEFFKDKKIGKVFVSPFPRTQKTAAIVCAGLGVSAIVEEDLKEMCYGSWDGVLKSELKGTELWKVRDADKYHFVHPGSYKDVEGESYDLMYPRIATLLKKLVDEHVADDVNILCIAHLGVVRNARRFFEDLSGEEAIKFSPHNDTAYVAEINSEGFVGSKVEQL